MMATTRIRGWAVEITIAVILVSSVSPVRAAPVVIEDAGNTRSMRPYLARLPTETSGPGKSSVAARLLPLVTPEMTPGKVEPTPIEMPPSPYPFFVIGSDWVSRDWLKKNRDRLVQAKAIGILVQAETVDDLNEIAKLGEGLVITPLRGSDIAKHLGLKHYPALVSSGWIEQ